MHTSRPDYARGMPPAFNVHALAAVLSKRFGLWLEQGRYLCSDAPLCQAGAVLHNCTVRPPCDYGEKDQ